MNRFQFTTVACGMFFLASITGTPAYSWNGKIQTKAKNQNSAGAESDVVADGNDGTVSSDGTVGNDADTGNNGTAGDDDIADDDTPTIGYFQFAPAIALEGFNDSYIEEAEMYGTCRIVQTTDSYDMSASLWLMGQYVFQDWALGKKKNSVSFTNFAPGMYMAVKAVGSNNEVFNGASVGLSLVWYRDGLGFKTKENRYTQTDIAEAYSRDERGLPEAGDLITGLDSQRDPEKWFQTINVSFGPAWHRTQTFQDGIVEGKPLPAVYDEIEYKKEDEISWVFMVSGSL